MNSIKRAIRKWLGVTSESYYPYRFVTMVTWQDKIIAVDGNGDLYELKPYGYTGDDFITTLMQKNPIERHPR